MSTDSLRYLDRDANVFRLIQKASRSLVQSGARREACAGEISQLKLHRSRGFATGGLEIVNDGAKAVAASGRSILIYPEGRLTPVGTYVPYRKSIWHMYNGTGLAVVPVPTNIGMRWPRRDWQKSAGPAAIEFLDPIEPGLGKAEFMTLLESRMESTTARLVREHGGAVRYACHLGRRR